MGRYESVRQTKDTAYTRGKELLQRAIDEKRNLTAAEENEYAGISSDLDALNAQLRRIDDDERSAAAAERALREIGVGADSRSYLSAEDREIDAEFRRTILEKDNKPIHLQIPSYQMRSGFQPGIEERALSTSSGSGLRGTSFWPQLQRHLVATSAILRAGATVIQTDSGEDLLVPRTSAFSSAGIVTEGSLIPTSDPTLGTVTFKSYKYAFLVQISRELAEDANFDIIGFLAEQSGIAIGNGFGTHAITGDGSAKPNGILPLATLGVTGPTGTATSFGTQGTAGQGGDLLLDLVASLAEPYARSASAGWLMRNATLNAIRKLKDTTGNYVFSTDVIPGSGSQGTIFGRPVYTDENMPAMGANAKSVLFGDLSRYWVRQVNDLRFERSDDYAFGNDLITFRAAARLDGNLVDTTGAVKYFAHSAT